MVRRLLLPVLGLLLFFGCTTPDSDDASGSNKREASQIDPVDLDLEEILERGYINAAVDYSSTSYFVYKGEIMGFEYELLKRLEDYFKVKVNITVEPSIESSIQKLNKGEIDIIAYPLTINKNRQRKIAFTEHYISQEQVLVQRKPENWRQMKLHEIEKTLIRDQVDLINKDVYVLNRNNALV